LLTFAILSHSCAQNHNFWDTNLSKSGTIVLGLGNPILGDDAVGCCVAAALEPRLQGRADTHAEPFYRGGIALMEEMVDYERAILVDAIQGLGGKAGTIHRLSLEDLPTLYANSPHDASLKAALELGRSLGAKLPSEIIIFAVEIDPGLDFSETLSPEVAASIAPLVEMVMVELGL
jgi:hydrogenase maturation protease